MSFTVEQPPWVVTANFKKSKSLKMTEKTEIHVLSSISVYQFIVLLVKSEDTVKYNTKLTLRSILYVFNQRVDGRIILKKILDTW